MSGRTHATIRCRVCEETVRATIPQMVSTKETFRLLEDEVRAEADRLGWKEVEIQGAQRIPRVNRAKEHPTVWVCYRCGCAVGSAFPRWDHVLSTPVGIGPVLTAVECETAQRVFELVTSPGVDDHQQQPDQGACERDPEQAEVLQHQAEDRRHEHQDPEDEVGDFHPEVSPAPSHGASSGGGAR